MKKLLLALGAIGLGVAAPAAAQSVGFDVHVHSGHPAYNHEYHQYNQFYDHRPYNQYYEHHEYRTYIPYYNRHYVMPRCNRWQVAVQNPYRPGTYYCVDRNSVVMDED